MSGVASYFVTTSNNSARLIVNSRIKVLGSSSKTLRMPVIVTGIVLGRAVQKTSVLTVQIQQVITSWGIATSKVRYIY